MTKWLCVQTCSPMESLHGCLNISCGICLGLYILWVRLISNCAKMKLGNVVCHISNSQNSSWSLRFFIYFQKLATETVLYVKLTLVPGKTGISVIHKGNPSFFCVCVYCSLTRAHTTPTPRHYYQKTFNKIAFLPSPSFSHLAGM